MRTLYKTKTLATYEQGEYFQPRVDVEFVNGKQIYFVRESHAHWSEIDKSIIHEHYTLNPEAYGTR